jgi:hypothetical protein
MMKKRIFVILICIAFFLCGCSPQFVSEVKANEAGLTLINRTFDVEETEAKVTLEERPGLSYINGVHAHLGGEEPIYYYTVKVGALPDGNSYYYAEVDAKTGLAYRAEKSTDIINLNDEQRKQAESIGMFDQFNPDMFTDEQEDYTQTVWDWISTHLEKDVPVMFVLPDAIGSDSVDFPKVRLGYFAMLDDGRFYNIEVCWPTMEVIFVQMRGYTLP